MSYTLPLPCGCTAYVSCWPDTGLAHTRVIEFRGATCRVRTHERGSRVYLWELLPTGHPTGDALTEARREQAPRGAVPA